MSRSFKDVNTKALKKSDKYYKNKNRKFKKAKQEKQEKNHWEQQIKEYL